MYRSANTSVNAAMDSVPGKDSAMAQAAGPDLR
jgi:hypothetical protein